MTSLSEDQQSRKAAIQKGATVWGVIAGAVVGLLALWLLGSQGSAVRYGGAIVAAVAVGVLAFRASFNSGAKSAKCAACGAAFSRSRTDRQETVTASNPKEEREEQEDGSTKVTRWTEDALDVLETYTCAKCGDETTRSFQTIRRRDETETTEPRAKPKAEPKSGKDGAKMGSWGGGCPAKGDSPKGDQG